MLVAGPWCTEQIFVLCVPGTNDEIGRAEKEAKLPNNGERNKLL